MSDCEACMPISGHWCSSYRMLACGDGAFVPSTAYPHLRLVHASEGACLLVHVETTQSVKLTEWDQYYRKCRWGQTIREHVQGGLQLHLSSSSKPPDCAVAALAELFTANTWLNAGWTLTFGTVSNRACCDLP